MRQEPIRMEDRRLRRFRIGFVAYGKPVMYTVSTWLDELMAVALAANVHADRHPRSPINDVCVEEIEPLPSGDVRAIPNNEVVNINEWR